MPPVPRTSWNPMRVLDRDVLIDVLRGHPPALASVMRAAASWQVYRPSAQHSATALELLARFYLSHNLGPFDALIAATALGLDAPLCTFNVRHFRVVPGRVTEQPYSR